MADPTSHERRSSSSLRSASSWRSSCVDFRSNRGRRQSSEHRLILFNLGQCAAQSGADNTAHLVDQERNTLNFGDPTAHQPNQILATQHNRQLTKFHLRCHHHRVTPQHVAQVSRERTQMPQVGMRDLDALAPCTSTGFTDRAYGTAPPKSAAAQHLRSDHRPSRSETRIPSILAWRNLTMRSWLDRFVGDVAGAMRSFQPTDAMF